MKAFKLLTAAFLATAAISAQASLITVSGGADYPTSPDNEFFYDPLVFEKYNIGGNISASEDLSVTYTRIGWESGWDQRFYVDGSLAIDKGSKTIATSKVMEGELFNFAFEAVRHDGTVLPQVLNGYNAGPDVPSFATALKVTYMGVFYDAIIMFDDTGGQNDDNHDDFVIGVNVAKVPEPSIVLLMGLGLLGLFGARRRKA